MSSSGSQPRSTFGFLTVIPHDQFGLFGGLLLLNPLGRPLEFHCSSPVKPNRTQEILYGPTLAPFVFGEQIAFALLAKARSEPRAVFTDVAPALAVRPLVEWPVAVLERPSPDQSVSPSTGESLSAWQPESPSSGVRFQLGDYQLQLAPGHAGDEVQIRTAWATAGGQIDLAEPFGRIREAIEEAQRSMK